jgi:hypothetical protein
MASEAVDAVISNADAAGRHSRRQPFRAQRKKWSLD